MGRGIIEADLFRTEQVEIEERTSDPADPGPNEAWLRVDIKPQYEDVDGNTRTGVAEYRVANSDGSVDAAPVAQLGDSPGDNVIDKVRAHVEGGGSPTGTGFVPYASSNAAFSQRRLEHPTAGQVAMHDALTASSAIPDSGLLHDYNAPALSLSDGASVDSWGDSEASRDLTAVGGPTYDADAINGVAGVSVDGVDDELWDGGGATTLTQPLYIFTVFEAVPDDLDFLVGSDEAENLGSNGSRFGQIVTGPNAGIPEGYRIDAGSPFDAGSSDQNPHIYGGLYDGTNSEIRIDGSSLGTGDAGTNDLTTIVLGSLGGQNYVEAKIGRVLFYDATQVDSQQVTEIEQGLADQFGITL